MLTDSHTDLLDLLFPPGSELLSRAMSLPFQPWNELDVHHVYQG
jgi:hypothetical protein